jgi:hypothetical protein
MMEHLAQIRAANIQGDSRPDQGCEFGAAVCTIAFGDEVTQQKAGSRVRKPRDPIVVDPHIDSAEQAERQLTQAILQPFAEPLDSAGGSERRRASADQLYRKRASIPT